MIIIPVAVSFILCWPLNSVLPFLFISSQDAEFWADKPVFQTSNIKHEHTQFYHYYRLIDRIFRANINI